MRLACLALVLLAAEARAQRGELYVEHEAEAASPMSGLPGVLDTHTVPRGRCVGSFPLLSLDCGVTDELSVGVVGSLLVLNAFGTPAANLRLRLRIHSARALTSTLDGVGGVFFADDSTLVAGYLASNTSLRLDRRHTMNVTVATAGQSISSQERGGGKLGVLIVAVTYEAALTSRWALSLTVGNAPLVTGSMENPSASIDLRRGLSDDVLARSFVRGLASWRFSRRAALSGGVWWSPAASLPLPSLALDVIW